MLTILRKTVVTDQPGNLQVLSHPIVFNFAISYFVFVSSHVDLGRINGFSGYKSIGSFRDYRDSFECSMNFEVIIVCYHERNPKREDGVPSNSDFDIRRSSPSQAISGVLNVYLGSLFNTRSGVSFIFETYFFSADYLR